MHANLEEQLRIENVIFLHTDEEANMHIMLPRPERRSDLSSRRASSSSHLNSRLSGLEFYIILHAI